MKNYIVKDKEFKIIPKDVTGATKCVVSDMNVDYFSVNVMSKEVFEPNDSVELFSITPQGLLYFETFVKNVNGDNVDMIYPVSHKFLQRREYTRIDFTKNILLKEKESGNNIKATVLDISAGGMKLTTSEEMGLTKDYKVNFEIDKNVAIDCYFQPIRIEADNLSGYTVSGRFKILKNIDRITLVQFCFKKQMENQNK